METRTEHSLVAGLRGKRGGAARSTWPVASLLIALSRGVAAASPPEVPAAPVPSSGAPSSPATAAGPTRAIVTLVTLGQFPRPFADAIVVAVERELQVTVRRIDAVPLPPSAYYAPRHRYRADRLLELLHSIVPGPPGQRVLAITDVDISTTKGKVYDWGVFGLGELGGRSCVISIRRLRRGARSPSHLEFRVVTTAIHEVGHTLGLPHCTEPRCVMLDAEGSIATTDSSSGHLGPGCRALLDERSPLPPAGATPPTKS